MMDFPTSPAAGTTVTFPNGQAYRWNGTGWDLIGTNLPTNTARRGNRVINPLMAVNQENPGAAVNANGSYPVDQWFLNFVGFALQSVQATTIYTLDGSRTAVLLSCSATRPSPAAGDLAEIIQRIEGSFMGDFGWGTSNAKPAVLRFSAYSEVAGDYSVAIGSSNSDYSWLGKYTLDGTGNLKTFTFAIPAQTAGTWNTDTTPGMLLRFNYACGTTYQGVAGWQAGNKIAVATQANPAAAAVNKNLCIADVGLWVDPDNTGLAPPWERLDPSVELYRCQRYFERQDQVLVIGTQNRTQRSWNAPKRASPSLNCVFNSGTGATYAPTTTNGWFQSIAHNADVQGNMYGNARM